MNRRNTILQMRNLQAGESVLTARLGFRRSHCSSLFYALIGKGGIDANQDGCLGGDH